MHADPSPTAATQQTAQIEWRGLEQVPPHERHGTPTRVGIMWFAAQLVPTAFFLGALGAQDYLGLSVTTAATAIVVGTLLGAAAPAVLGLTGPHTGLAQLAQAKSIFGRSIVFVGVLAAFTSVAFIALASIFGAQTLYIIFDMPFLPAIVTVFVLVGVVSVLGYRFMHLFENIMAVVVGAGFVGITIAMVRHRAEIGASLSDPGGANQHVGFLLMAAISFSFTFAWAHNAADYCRYLPVSVSKTKLFLCVFVGISCACIWLELLGLAAGSLMPDVSAMGSIHDLVGGGSVSVLILAAMFLGVVANATVAQYSAGLQLLAAGVRLPRPVVTILTAVVALAVASYLQAGDLAERFTNVMLLASYWVASFVGVAAVFWWRRPRVDDLVSVAGIYIRDLPWRPAAISALAIGFVGCLPFSNTSLGSELAADGGVLAAIFGSVSRAWFGGADLAYPAGILLSGGCYAIFQLTGQRRSATGDR